MYGPRENESHAIIAFIAKAMIQQDPYEVWGTGNQDRNFTYVSDVVDGLKLACENITDCRSINIGTSEITAVKDAVYAVCALMGHTPKEFFFDTSKPEGVHARAANTANQELWLGWKPQVTFQDGIRKTIEWYKANRNAEDLKKDFQKKLFER